MLPQLRVLNALSSIFESLAQDYTGEAKGELSELIDSLANDPAFDVPDIAKLLEDVMEALDLVRAGKKERAAFTLMLHSRALWRQMSAQLATDAPKPGP